jgi:hypothetical protein
MRGSAAGDFFRGFGRQIGGFGKGGRLWFRDLQFLVEKALF